ncbi:ABC transporter ATP-binding protein [Streptosporangium carneum]|uniref:Dipeptide/oligopeptide/nickel ABC transporter ATP-binding protein n=1 Tax=Streptosporangium carneum TaxID=47481 RepID=A0A9W6MG48_9ACTN|nr:ABC transporter ATP-binding protein [Streptosporangium carneum]GLK12762.1 dipeptide/oligopeptide/nickel ABC transporter ATP-binding protein [Streptosporangium carneum]
MDRSLTGAVHAAALPGDPLLVVDGLSVHYGTSKASKAAVDDVSFTISRGDRVGLVGESGSGKSTLASAILRILPAAATVRSGRIELGGEDLLALKPAALRSIRSTRVARVPQDPLGSLNPVFTIGRQLSDVVTAHRRIGRRERTTLVEEALRQVGIGDAAVKRRSYPHELSGGMRQRVMIAMALLNHPDLLIADEPTTALDVTVQAQVVELLRERVDKSAMTLLLISHDIGVISELCTKVMVMYGGRVVEQGAAADVLVRPSHPYTRSLLDAARGKVTAYAPDPTEVVS